MIFQRTSCARCVDLFYETLLSLDFGTVLDIEAASKIARVTAISSVTLFLSTNVFTFLRKHLSHFTENDVCKLLIF